MEGITFMVSLLPATSKFLEFITNQNLSNYQWMKQKISTSDGSTGDRKQKGSGTIQVRWDVDKGK